VTGSGRAFFEEACARKLEGIVSKKRQAPYQPGRTRTWVKVKCLREQELVIGGFTDPEGSREGIGALLLGVHDDKGLRYAGRVGTGFGGAMLRELRRRLKPLERQQSPFADKVTGRAVGRAHWVEPRLVAEVAFTEWTADGKLRHPSFKGLREDKRAEEIVKEQPVSIQTPKPKPKANAKTSDVEVEGVRLTHPDRMLYPDIGITKLDLARFYVSIADWILPHLQGRPTTLVRCPDGLGKPCFYQKHTGTWAPPSLRRVPIQEQKKVGEYLVVDDLPGLVGLVQIGILEIHTWNATDDRLEQPDRLVFDLDPDPSVDWKRTVEAAREVRDLLAERGLVSFVKTTGGKGVHIVTPLVPEATWDACAGFAAGVAAELVRRRPEAYTDNMSKARRKGKIFIDYLRNVRGATSVAAYSTRAKPAAPISTPVDWQELGPRLGPDGITLKSLPRRLARRDVDPWKEYEKARRRLPVVSTVTVTPGRAAPSLKRS